MPEAKDHLAGSLELRAPPPPVGPYSSPVHRALWWSQRDGLFLTSEVPLYHRGEGLLGAYRISSTLTVGRLLYQVDDGDEDDLSSAHPFVSSFAHVGSDVVSALPVRAPYTTTSGRDFVKSFRL